MLKAEDFENGVDIIRDGDLDPEYFTRIVLDGPDGSFFEKYKKDTLELVEVVFRYDKDYVMRNYSLYKPTKVIDNSISPYHYKQGGIETLDYLEAKLTPEEFQGFCKANILKYLSREKLKNGLQDIKKCTIYLERLIKSREKA